MIDIRLYTYSNEEETTSDKKIIGFHVSGHAFHGEYGNDIVCAAVSALAINTINAIEVLTDNDIEYLYDEDGALELLPRVDFDEKALLLLDALYVGIKAIIEEYNTEGNSEYITLKLEEV